MFATLLFVRTVSALGFFVTEMNYDFVQLVDAAGTWKYTGTLNSSPTPEIWSTHWWTPFPAALGAQSFTLQFSTDSSVADWAPPVFSSVKASCRASQTTTTTNNRIVPTNTRVDGILIATGDTIYMQVTQTANVPMLISLDAKSLSAVDFDLYASEINPRPDDSSFLVRSSSGSGSEAVEIPVAGNTRTIYIGVHSYSGAGHFAINAMQQMPWERMSLVVCPISFTPTSTERTAIAALMRAGSARLLAGSNGNQFIKSFTIASSQANCSLGCDLCLFPGTSTTGNGLPLGGHPCGQVNLGGGFWGGGAAFGAGLHHEFGHSCYGLLDEYTGPPAGSLTTTTCGHSVMNNSGSTRMFCSVRHCLDGHAATGCGGLANWQSIAGRIYFGASYGASVAAVPNIFETNANLLNQIFVF